MFFFDSHAHFGKKEGVKGYDAILARSFDAGTKRIMAIGGSHGLNSSALKVSAEYAENVKPAIGFDRDHLSSSTGEDYRISLAILENLLDVTPEVLAIGEIGLDYHYGAESAKEQKFLFEAQLEVSRERKLPVIVHSRDADKDMEDILFSHVNRWKGNIEQVGVLHCYTGGEGFAKRLLELGFYISFSGIVTFKSADIIRNVVTLVPDSRILIETDSPYLAPVPMRGKSNEPSYVKFIAEILSRIRNVQIGHIAEITWDNASRLFNWDSVKTTSYSLS